MVSHWLFRLALLNFGAPIFLPRSGRQTLVYQGGSDWLQDGDQPVGGCAPAVTDLNIKWSGG